MTKSLGMAAVLGYFGLFYFLPLVIMFFAGAHRNFVNDGNAVLGLAVVSIVLFFALLIRLTKISLPTAWARRVPDLFKAKWIVLGIGMLTIPIAISFKLQYGAGFRYSGEGIASGGIVPQYIIFYKAFYYSYIIYWFLRLVNGDSISAIHRFCLLLHGFNWLLCINGAADVLWVAMAIGVGAMGKGARVFFVRKKSGVAANTVNRVLALILITTASAGIVFFGFVNKLGIEGAVERFGYEKIGAVGYYLYYRLAVFPSSMEHLLSYGLNWDLYHRALDAVWETINYRVGLILGFDADRPEIASINMLNYREIFKYPILDRTGASPGVIGAFLYLPVFPVNLLFASLYVAAVINLYSRSAAILERERFSAFTVMFMVIASYSLLHNPVDSFLKVGPDLAKTLLILYAFEKARYKKSKIRTESSRVMRIDNEIVPARLN